MVRPAGGKRPPLLLLMMVVTGLVDAVSYPAPGRVFVANTTGNLVLGFARCRAEIAIRAWAVAAQAS